MPRQRYKGILETAWRPGPSRYTNGLEDSGFGKLKGNQWPLEWLTMADLCLHDSSARQFFGAGGVLPCVASHLATEGLASRSSALQDKVQTNRDGKSANGDLFKMSWCKCSKLMQISGLEWLDLETTRQRV